MGRMIALAVIAVVGLTVVPPASSTAAPRDTTVASVLGALETAPSMTLAYRFSDFGSPRPRAKDGRGCGERERVLLASATTRPSIGAGCTLRGGAWTVNGRTVRSARAIDVVPLVSEKGAWSQGAFGWSPQTQRSFVRWYQGAGRECAVSAARSTQGCGYVLQQRGSGGLSAQVTDRMSQTRTPLTCPEAAGITGILASWGLAVDPTVRARIEGADCSSAPVRVATLNQANPVFAGSLRNPYLAPGVGSRAWMPTEVLSAPAGPVIDASQFGLHIPDVTGPEPSVPFTWLRLWDAKTGWEPLEQNRGTYYWEWIDRSVAYAEARGLRVMYVFGDTPAWAGPSPAFPPSSLNEFRRYVDAVVSRYGNRIAAYEVWNEPNLYSPISDQVANLVDMTLVVHDAVRRWAPGSLVLTPSTTMRTDTAVYPFFSEYLVPLAAKGWPVDGFTVHSYPRAAGGPAARAAHLGQFRQMLTLAGAPDLPVWDTEVNYGLGGLQEAKRDIGQPDASGYLAQTFLDSVRMGVTQTDWYLWFPRDYALLGIQTTPATIATNRAWQWVYDQLVGSRMRACSSTATAVICGFERGGTPFAIAWSSTGERTSIEVPSNLAVTCGISSGCTQITGGRVTVGIEPQRLA